MSGVWLAINTFGTMGLLAVFDAMGMRIDCVESSSSVRRQTFLIYPHSLDLTPALLHIFEWTIWDVSPCAAAVSTVLYRFRKYAQHAAYIVRLLWFS